MTTILYKIVRGIREDGKEETGEKKTGGNAAFRFYDLQPGIWKIRLTGNIILDGVILGIKCRIGDGNIFTPGCIIGHHSVLGDFNYLSINASICGNVKIGDNCFWGSNTCAKDGIKVADTCLIGAGCFIDKNIVCKESVFSSSPVKKIDVSSIKVMNILNKLYR